MATTIVPGAVTATDAAREVACTHCALPVPAGFLIPGDEKQFCCAGCRSAFAILHEHGLEGYYALAERRGAAVQPTGRAYEEFDHPAFHALYVRPVEEHGAPTGLMRVELYLEGVHCASCVWLVERVPLLLDGVARAELNVRRALATVEWDPAVVPLSRVARALDTLGYRPHPFRGVRRDEMRRKEDRQMLARIGVAGAIAGNVMLAALALYSGLFDGMEREYERFFRWLSLVLTVPTMLYPARVFFTGAWAALRARTLNMDVPIAIGLAAGFVRGAMNTVTDSGEVYFDGVCVLVFLLLVGRFVQQRGQRRAADSAELLYSLAPTSARVIEGGGTRDVPTEALLPGMELDVRAGETLPADGVVTSGHTTIDASLLTGESRPVGAGAGDRVWAGTLNVAAPVRVRVEEAGETSRLAKILRQVEDSAARRAPVVQLANRMSGWFVLVVLALAAVTFFLWMDRDAAAGVDYAIALLIVTCPCALALSTPLAVSVAVGRAARGGIFIKGGDALEQLAKTGTILLDKTGTITEARTALVHWEGPAWVRPLVRALEEGSTHPIADGFRRALADEPLLRVEYSEHVTGGGIAGRVQGQDVVIGSPAFVRSRAAAGEPFVEPWSNAWTPVLIAVDGAIIARAGFGDPVRGDAAESIRVLRARGWTVGILSGDAPEVVAEVARALSLPAESCVGGASPEEKLRRVEAARGHGPVVMVGDGVNDAAAIAAADVGIAVHGGAEAALSTADVYCTVPGLAPLVRLVRGSGRTMRVIRRNIVFSLGYNVIGVALAMTGTISPLIAALMMPASSLTVVLASWYGRTFQDAGEAR